MHAVYTLSYNICLVYGEAWYGIAIFLAMTLNAWLFLSVCVGAGMCEQCVPGRIFRPGNETSPDVTRNDVCIAK